MSGRCYFESDFPFHVRGCFEGWHLGREVKTDSHVAEIIRRLFWIIYGLFKRKNKLPVADELVTHLVVPLSLIRKPEFVQLVVEGLLFCCKTNPVENDGHEIMALLLAAIVMLKAGRDNTAGTPPKVELQPVVPGR